MSNRAVTATLAVLLLLPVPVRAQSFDAPAFHTPYGEDGLGLHLVMPDEVTELGVMGTLRRSSARVDLGLRGTVMELDDAFAMSGGLDVKNELVAANPRFPLDVAWVTGVGVTGVPDRDVAQVRLPFGVSVGRRLSDGEVSLTPYLYPRLALDLTFLPEDRTVGGPLGRNRQGDQTDLHADVDLGVDASFVAGWVFRLAVTLGQNEAVGLGLAVTRF